MDKPSDDINSRLFLMNKKGLKHQEKHELNVTRPLSTFCKRQALLNIFCEWENRDSADNVRNKGKWAKLLLAVAIDVLELL